MSDGSPLDRRYQVFVSSTYVDLVPERRAVIQALLELDCIPAGMEMFPAADDDQWTLIKEVIDSCDYYIVVVGGRYGSVTEEGISFTEMEYDYAVAQGLPVLGFVHADPGSIPADHSELEPKAREKLDAFRKKVMTRMVKTYSNPDELASVVSRGLIRSIRTNPRPGWVRGDHVMTDAVRAEIAELRAALSDAERKQSEAEAGREVTEIDGAFEHGDDTVTLSCVVVSTAFDFERRPLDCEVTFTWDEIVELLGPYMLDEAPEGQLRAILDSAAMATLLAGEHAEQIKTIFQPTASITDDSWGRVLVQLRALGMIRTGVKKRTVSDKAVYWTLTPAGDEYLVRLKATTRQGS